MVYDQQNARSLFFMVFAIYNGTKNIIIVKGKTKKKKIFFKKFGYAQVLELQY